MIHLIYVYSYYCMVLGDNHITHVRYIKMETTNYIKHVYVINKHCIVQPWPSLIILCM